MKKRNTAQYYTFLEYGVDGEFIVGYNIGPGGEIVLKDIYAIDSDIDISDMILKDVEDDFITDIELQRANENEIITYNNK